METAYYDRSYSDEDYWRTSDNYGYENSESTYDNGFGDGYSRGYQDGAHIRNKLTGPFVCYHLYVKKSPEGAWEYETDYHSLEDIREDTVLYNMEGTETRYIPVHTGMFEDPL